MYLGKSTIMPYQKHPMTSQSAFKTLDSLKQKNGSGLELRRRLSGQHATYVETQLKNFRSGVRANDAGSMMRGVASKMSDAEIAAVAQYVQGLH